MVQALGVQALVVLTSALASLVVAERALSQPSPHFELPPLLSKVGLASLADQAAEKRREAETGRSRVSAGSLAECWSYCLRLTAVVSEDVQL